MGRRSDEIEPLDPLGGKLAPPGAGERASTLPDASMGQPGASDYEKVDVTEQRDDEPEVVAARGRIKQTRAEMGETIDAIQERLQPGVLARHARDAAREAARAKADQVKGAVRQATIDTAGKVSGAMGAATGKAQGAMDSAGTAISGAGQRMQDAVAAGVGNTGDAMQSARTKVAGKSGGLIDTVRLLPIPAALITAGALVTGLGWLFARSRRDSAKPSEGSEPSGMPGSQVTSAADNGFQAQDTGGMAIVQAISAAPGSAGQMADRAIESVSQLGDQAMGSLSQLREQTKGSLGRLGDRATKKTRRARGGFATVLQDNPLAVGVAVAGLGMVVGLAVPETEKENELLGEARDSLIDKAGQAVRDTARNAVRETLGRS